MKMPNLGEAYRYCCISRLRFLLSLIRVGNRLRDATYPLWPWRSTIDARLVPIDLLYLLKLQTSVSCVLPMESRT